MERNLPSLFRTQKGTHFGESSL
uniref:Uncharacterized protein n=1 Tax=Rhizophora mucronata TaxID=61149 RepID=A0A2P2NPU7_RHIMU